MPRLKLFPLRSTINRPRALRPSSAPSPCGAGSGFSGIDIGEGIDVEHLVVARLLLYNMAGRARATRLPSAVVLSWEGQMTFRLVHAQFERTSNRAYVELREADADGGDVIVTAIFSLRRADTLTKRALEQDLTTKAQHLMRRASVGLDGRSGTSTWEPRLRRWRETSPLGRGEP